MRPALWLVAYDIADPRRLRRVAAQLESAGERIQKSVFHCVPEYGQIKSIRTRLASTVEDGVDRILFQPICSQCRAQALNQGRLPPPATEPYWVI